MLCMYKSKRRIFQGQKISALSTNALYNITQNIFLLLTFFKMNHFQPRRFNRDNTWMWQGVARI